MFQLEKLLGARTTITIDQANRIRALVADWQLLADLSFADLILWVPIRKDVSMWPTGHIAVAHIRPTTTSTVFINDVIGDEVLWGAKPGIDEALSGDEIVKSSDPEKIGEMLVKTETIPVTFEGQVIAVISSHRNVEHSRGSGKLETNYREVAQHLYHMVAQGSFSPKEMMYSEAIFNLATEVARLCNVPAYYVSADQNNSMTYANVQDERKQFLTLSLQPFITAIEDRLSMDDITARGHVVKFDIDKNFLRTDPMQELAVIEKLLDLNLITTEQAMEMTDLSPNGSNGME